MVVIYILLHITGVHMQSLIGFLEGYDLWRLPENPLSVSPFSLTHINFRVQTVPHFARIDIIFMCAL